jgi:hypothetical protein
MSYPVIGFSYQSQKKSYNYPQSFPFESHVPLKFLDDYDTLSIKKGLDIFTRVISPYIQVSWYSGFSELKKFIASDTQEIAFRFTSIVDRFFQILEKHLVRNRDSSFDVLKWNMKIR